MKAKLFPVLAAEDEESDRFILQRAFERSGLNHPLILVRDGREALDYLSGDGAFADRALHPLPRLVILDLKMPRLSGFDVLAWLVARPDFKDLPAVVLSSSSDDADIQKARQLGARDYFVKPHSLDELVTIIRGLHDRWLSVTGNFNSSTGVTQPAVRLGAPFADPV
jgi:CheY-like chemotaxis protein